MPLSCTADGTTGLAPVLYRQMPGATPEFKQQLKTAFDALQVGQTFTFRRTFNDGDVSLFCGVTGDYNPYHFDDTFAHGNWFGRRIIPGLLTASMMTHVGGLIGFLAQEMHFHFLSAVYIGDAVDTRKGYHYHKMPLIPARGITTMRPLIPARGITTMRRETAGDGAGGGREPGRLRSAARRVQRVPGAYTTGQVGV